RIDIFLDEFLHEHQEQEQNDRRNVDAAKVGQNTTDRPQQRLGQSVEEIPDGTHDFIAKVDHVEGQQPGHDCRSDNHVAVEIENAENQVEERVHGWSNMARTRNLEVRLGSM